MSNFGGGGRGRGRGRGRGGGRTGGRGNQANIKAKLSCCKNYVANANCTFNNSCSYAHVIRSHAQIETPWNKEANNHHTRYDQGGYHNQQYNKRFPVSSVAIWETQGSIKFFLGSHDGYWRLYNTNSFEMEFENMMGDGKGKVRCVEVASNYLFCGFEGISTKLPSVKVGMIHAWNLNSPADPPLEFHMSPLAPYAHTTTVSRLITVAGAVISGSGDGTIRLWQFNPALENGKGGFALSKTLHGHAREVTGLTVVSNTILWSSSVDQSIRLWDLNSAECKHVICKNSTQNGTQHGNSQLGHDDAITAVLTFENELGKFVISGSLDGTIKAWNGETGECLASENNNVGVVSMALTSDIKGNPMLLCGLIDGSLVIRNVLQIQNSPAFSALVCLTSFYHPTNHEGAIQCIKSGPSNSFYSGGKDGKLIVWQITGDLGS